MTTSIDSNSPRVIIAGLHFKPILPYLQKAFPGIDAEMVAEADLESKLANADVVVPTMVRISDDHMACAPHLRLIHQWGAGLEGVDIPSATLRGIAVANVPTAGSGNAESVAEWCVMAAICLSRRYPQVQAQVQQGLEWGFPDGMSLLGKTAGIIGLGGIGKALAERLKPFGMRLLGLKRSHDEAMRQQLGLDWSGTMHDLPTLLKESDYIFICTPLAPETTDLFNHVAFQQMKANAYLINAARGGIVNEQDLLVALEAEMLSGVAMDVFWQEPIRSDHSVVHHPKVLCTPHIAGVTDVSYSHIAEKLGINIKRVMQNELPLNCANPEVTPWF